MNDDELERVERVLFNPEPVPDDWRDVPPSLLIEARHHLRRGERLDLLDDPLRELQAAP